MTAKPVKQDAAAKSLDYYRREAPKPVKTTEQSALDQMFGYYAA